MIVDVFPYFNEIEILEIRLNLLENVVDKFVIVEHDIDFNNQPKKFNLEPKINELNSKFKNKIDYIKIKSTPMLDDRWSQEIHQKNNLACALEMYPDSYFLFGDLDEVPNPEIIPKAIELYEEKGPCILLLYWCINKCNVVLKQRWPGPVVGKKADVIKAGGARKFMCPRGSKSMHWKSPFYPELYPAGWHWSFFGDPSRVVEKLDSVLEGNKIRRKMRGNDEKIIREGKFMVHIGKFCGESLDELPENLYNNNVKSLLSKYPSWWQ
jgi:hypothetical protein